jgi:hypothetical protein
MSSPGAASSAPPADVECPCGCIHSKTVFTNRPFLRLLVFLFNAVSCALIIVLEVQQSVKHRSTLQDPAIIAFVIFTGLGAIVSLIWFTTALCSPHPNGALSVRCKDDRVCRCINYELATDLIFGCFIGLLSILMVQRSPCTAANAAFTDWCSTYNASVSFGFIVLLPYFLVLSMFHIPDLIPEHF